jgi:DNA-binding transcriptional LysR family regulator
MADPVPRRAADLDTVELRSFVVLAEQRHFGRAAEALFVTQPALSKRLRRLEEKTGTALLERGPHEVRLTEAGRLLLERARSLLREAEAALELSRLAGRGEAGALRLGFGVASIARLLPEVLLRFARSHPRVRVEMRDMSSPEQTEALRRGELDLGFVRLPVSGADFESVPVLRERLVLAVGPRARWREGASLASVAGQPFVVCSRRLSASYYDHVLALCRAAGFTPRIVTETNELFSLLQLVRAGVGLALVPSAAEAMHVPGVRMHRTRLALAAWEVGLVWRRPPERRLLVEAFVATARAAASERGVLRRKHIA